MECEKIHSLANITPMASIRYAEHEQQSASPNSVVVQDTETHPSTASSASLNFLRVGHRGVARCVIVGVEEVEASIIEEQELLPRISDIAANAHHMKIVLLSDEWLEYPSKLPSTLRTLTVTMQDHSAYRYLKRRGPPLCVNLPGVGLQLSHTLTELVLTRARWNSERFPLHLPSSLVVLKLPRFTGYALPSFQLPQGLTTLDMGDWGLPDWPLDPAAWVAAYFSKLPSSLTWLHCGINLRVSLSAVQLPVALQHLYIEWVWNAPMPLDAWPSTLPDSLITLEVHNSDVVADQLCGRLPVNLQRLKLAGPICLISSWVLPSSLTELDIERDMEYSSETVSGTEPVFPPERISFQPSLRKISLPIPDESAPSNITLPAALSFLNLHCSSGVPLDPIILPEQLGQLHLGGAFDQSLRAVRFPNALHSLQLGGDGSFKQPLVQWRPPTSLTDLELGIRWNLPLSDLWLPASLRRLTFKGFNQPLVADFNWPAELEYLSFKSNRFRQQFDQWNPPPRLKHLHVNDIALDWRFSLDNQRWPPMLSRLDLPANVGFSRILWNWRPMLEEWTIDLIVEVNLTRTSGLLPFSFFEDAAISRIPPSLRKLRLMLPIDPQTHPDLWPQLVRFAKMLPRTVRELIVTLRYESRELYNSIIPRIREFANNLPPSCSLSLVDAQESYISFDLADSVS